MAGRAGYLPALLAIWLLGLACPTSASVAFYYGRGIPQEATHYDFIVLQPSQVSPAELDELKKKGTQPLAYLSIGEVARTAAEMVAVRPEWRLGQNEHWDSVVLDVRRPEVQLFLVEMMAAAAWRQGFKGFFLDTLDSYRLTEEGRSDESGFQQALVAVIQRLATTFNKPTLILNRGFEFASRVSEQIQAVAFESLYSRYSVADDDYRAVPPNDREWLLAQVLPLVKNYGLEVIAIDYLPENDASVSDLIQRIEAHGLSAWVGDGLLAHMGQGSGRHRAGLGR